MRSIESNRPGNDELEKAYKWSAKWWEVVLAGMPAYGKAIADPWSIPDMRRYGEKWSLLFRPVAQVALFRGLGFAKAAGMSVEDAVDRATHIDWHADTDFWIDTVIRSNGRMVAHAQSIRLAGRLIAYLVAADLMTDTQTDRLRNDYAAARGWMIQHRRPMPKLPKPVK